MKVVNDNLVTVAAPPLNLTSCGTVDVQVIWTGVSDIYASPATRADRFSYGGNSNDRPYRDNDPLG